MAANVPASTPAVPASATTFPAVPSQVREARLFLASVLNGCPARDDALLCLSELATNAVLHSRSARDGGHFTVRAVAQDGRVRVEVEDDGGPWEPAGGHPEHNGRGLAIVSALASRHGRDGDDTRRTVWFELETP